MFVGNVVVVPDALWLPVLAEVVEVAEVVALPVAVAVELVPVLSAEVESDVDSLPPAAAVADMELPQESVCELEISPELMQS